MFWIFLLVVAFSFIGTELCSINFWLSMLGFIVLMISINMATGSYLNKQHKLKEQLKYEYDEHDLVWSAFNIFIISVVSLISGFTAGLLGIGGGAIMGPVMLKLNVRPEVSAATSSFIIVFTSSIAILQYASDDKIRWDYSFFLIGLAVLGAMIGILGLKRLSEKYERPSLLVLSLGTIMAIAIPFVILYGVIKMVKDAENDNEEYGFSSC